MAIKQIKRSQGSAEGLFAASFGPCIERIGQVESIVVVLERIVGIATHQIEAQIVERVQAQLREGGRVPVTILVRLTVGHLDLGDAIGLKMRGTDQEIVVFITAGKARVRLQGAEGSAFQTSGDTGPTAAVTGYDVDHPTQDRKSVV